MLYFRHMYLFPIEAKASTIEGKGVFALLKIPKGQIVWKFVEGHDKTLSINEFNALDEYVKKELLRVAYLSATTNRYVYPPENDPANFTNHSKAFNLSAVTDPTISEEPFFIANRDIEVGEEMTNNYSEFDETIKTDRPEWI